MLGKLLLTTLVILTVLFVFRFRDRVPRGSLRISERLPKPDSPPPWWVRFLAVGAIATMVSGTALYYYWDWKDRHTIVTVRVVNTNSGQAVDYLAEKGEIGFRSFATVTGRRITLADVERLEVIENDQLQQAR